MIAAPSLHWWAPVSAAAYAAVSLAVGDVFPFCRYRMYATAARRRVGAVPFFRADGVEVSIDEFLAFRDYSGINPASIWPKHLPCSMEWQLVTFQRWLREHIADEDLLSGPIEVEFGFRILSVGRSGRLAEEIKIVAKGAAYPC